MFRSMERGTLPMRVSPWRLTVIALKLPFGPMKSSRCVFCARKSCEWSHALRRNLRTIHLCLVRIAFTNGNDWKSPASEEKACSEQGHKKR
jgi:hypothetical protein